MAPAVPTAGHPIPHPIAPAQSATAAGPTHPHMKRFVPHSSSKAHSATPSTPSNTTALAPLLLPSSTRSRPIDFPQAVDLVTAVPMSGRRRRQRGYNQADQIARQLAARLHTPFDPRALQRPRLERPTGQTDQPRSPTPKRRRRLSRRSQPRSRPPHPRCRRRHHLRRDPRRLRPRPPRCRCRPRRRLGPRSRRLGREDEPRRFRPVNISVCETDASAPSRIAACRVPSLPLCMKRVSHHWLSNGFKFRPTIRFGIDSDLRGETRAPNVGAIREREPP